MKSRSKTSGRLDSGSKFILMLALLALIYPAWKFTSRLLRPNDDAVVRSLVADEETDLRLEITMRELTQALQQGRLPGDSPAAGVFASEVTITDLGAPPDFTISTGRASLVSHSWPVATQTQTVAKVDLWRPLLDQVSSFAHAHLYIIHGHHPEGDMWHYESQGGFDALAQMNSGEWRSLHGTMRLDWKRDPRPDGSPGAWQITAWHTQQLEWIASPKRFFTESLDSAMRTPREAAQLRRSLHYEATVNYYRSGMKKPPHPYFAPISVNQKEGLAIADVNGDGFDDIYITVRLGKNMLLVNQGDGTFVEQAALYQLNLPGHTTCALFADFDNDGDQDVMLGRSLLRSSYLENRDGVYYQHPIPKFMPMAAISMAATDYNMDGLLDVYICTYRPAAPMGASPAGGVALGDEGAFDWPDEFFSPELAQEYRRRLAEHNDRHGGTVLDQIGPPNMLLVNRGNGRFEPAPENDVVGSWRNSLQATWGDYNEDGKPDLYIANDWGLDELYRNDGPDGFTEISGEIGLTAYGFAMGASWGDFNNDGEEDLYVSNMYSAAGRRMTTRIPDLHEMFVESAAGNWLYQKGKDGSFTQVAGLDRPDMTVMNAGWSWGGCFVDFDNDRYLDLYVLSGYFTAPEELASDIDIESNLWRTMVRTDVNLARRSFRFSPEWKRTPAPDNLGPQIDTRLAGVERHGDQVRVHSLNGSERNHYFANLSGQSFLDISAISGLDNIADSRGFSVLDYDRDGWQDVALVNANQPLFNLYHNEMPASGFTGGMVALRFVGGNRTAQPNSAWACRDGYGARVTINLDDEILVREHRCGDGWSTQNSATMIVGIGNADSIPSLTVTWPSGKTATARDLAEGTLLTVYEDLTESPSGDGFTRAKYRVEAGTANPDNR